MFKKVVIVPKVTKEIIDAFEEMAPGIRNVVELPLITSEVFAIDHAVKYANRTLRPTTEYVSSASVIEETETGWNVELTIFGD